MDMANLNERILYQPKLNIAYLHNPKVACSTFKNTLLFGEVENVHAQYLFPPYNNKNVDIFSVVRNPFSRTVSAYLDKIGPNKDHYVWNPFCQMFGLDPKKEIDFKEFIDLIGSIDDQNRLDHHFRPQNLNLLHEYVSPKFVGYLEDMKTVKEYLSLYNIEIEDRAPHKTKSKEKSKNLLTDSIVDRILDIYKKDFDIYGYSTDPNSKSVPIATINQQSVKDDVVFEHSTFDIRNATELLRDAAVLLESTNIDKSYELMSLAKKLRPLGPFINSKLDDYKKALNLI